MSKERLTYVVLSIFLILSGLVTFVSGLGSLGIVISILALAAGILILVARPDVSMYTGWVLAAIYLILLGLTGIVSFNFNGLGTIMAVLALAAGIILLVKWAGFRHHIGFLLFIVWLILVGLTGLVSLSGMGVVIAVVAIASGILMILNE